MTDRRASHWSVTINNPTDADEEAITLARQRGWKVEGQLEEGAEGTKHYQLAVNTPQVRFAALKKAFPRAHIEIARNPAALGVYVHKEQSKVGELPEQSDKYPSLVKLWDLIYDRISDRIGAPADEHIWGAMKPAKVMEFFDDAIAELISDGFHVETMAVNPQIRCCFAKFARVLLVRAYGLRQAVRQTHVQATEIPVAQESINNAHDNSSSFGSSSSELP